MDPMDLSKQKDEENTFGNDGQSILPPATTEKEILIAALLKDLQNYDEDRKEYTSQLPVARNSIQRWKIMISDYKFIINRSKKVKSDWDENERRKRRNSERKKLKMKRHIEQMIQKRLTRLQNDRIRAEQIKIENRAHKKRLKEISNRPNRMLLKNQITCAKTEIMRLQFFLQWSTSVEFMVDEAITFIFYTVNERAINSHLAFLPRETSVKCVEKITETSTLIFGNKDILCSCKDFDSLIEAFGASCLKSKPTTDIKIMAAPTKVILNICKSKSTERVRNKRKDVIRYPEDLNASEYEGLSSSIGSYSLTMTDTIASIMEMAIRKVPKMPSYMGEYIVADKDVQFESKSEDLGGISSLSNNTMTNPKTTKQKMDTSQAKTRLIHKDEKDFADKADILISEYLSSTKDLAYTLTSDPKTNDTPQEVNKSKKDMKTLENGKEDSVSSDFGTHDIHSINKLAPRYSFFSDVTNNSQTKATKQEFSEVTLRLINERNTNFKTIPIPEILDIKSQKAITKLNKQSEATATPEVWDSTNTKHRGLLKSTWNTTNSKKSNFNSKMTNNYPWRHIRHKSPLHHEITFAEDKATDPYSVRELETKEFSVDHGHPYSIRSNWATKFKTRETPVDLNQKKNYISISRLNKISTNSTKFTWSHKMTKPWTDTQNKPTSYIEKAFKTNIVPNNGDRLDSDEDVHSKYNDKTTKYKNKDTPVDASKNPAATRLNKMNQGTVTPKIWNIANSYTTTEASKSSWTTTSFTTMEKRVPDSQTTTLFSTDTKVVKGNKAMKHAIQLMEKWEEEP